MTQANVTKATVETLSDHDALEGLSVPDTLHSSTLLRPLNRPSTEGQNDELTPTRDRFFRRKYVVDRCLGCCLLVLTSPLTCFLYCVVRMTSPGPGFYRQRRVGLNGEVFEIVKLRSMVNDAERNGQAIWCVKNDSRVTLVGRILRRLHLDELPQLFNVARGEMSLVGPRPERPQICESLARQIDGYYDRVRVKPGVTGLSQINLPPDETLDDVRRKQLLDLRYIEEASWWLEYRIIMATAMRMFGIRGEVVMKSMRLCRRQLLRELEVDSCGDVRPSCCERTDGENRTPSADSHMAAVSAGPRRPR